MILIKNIGELVGIVPKGVLRKRGAEMAETGVLKDAWLEIEDGKIKEYIHTYLKVAFKEDTDIADFANRMGYSSPRLSTIIPDLLKFTADKLLVGTDPAAVLEILNKIAKPLRYRFSNDLHVVKQSVLESLGTKIENAFDEAVALANAFISE